MRGRLQRNPRWFMGIGVVLCFLAAIFAFEAKLAWFSPAGTPTAQISFAKLQPSDAPKLIAQALAAPDASQHFPVEAPLLLAIALLLALLVRFDSRKLTHDGNSVYASASCSPPLFRRPPPDFV